VARFLPGVVGVEESRHADIAVRSVVPIRLVGRHVLADAEAQTDESPGWRPGCSIISVRGNALGVVADPKFPQN
jgi:hypothetical protein